MFRLTPSTQEAINHLWAERSKLGWRLRKATVHRVVELLARIGACNEPFAIPQILPFLIDKNTPVARAACGAIGQVLPGASSADYVGLSSNANLVLGWSSDHAPWRALKPDDVPRFLHDDDSRFAFLGLATWHLNGFVRQAAMSELEKYPAEIAWPFMLLRANDWVKPIRDQAVAFIGTHLASVDLAALTKFLPLVLRLLDCGRKDHRELVHAIVQQLARQDDGESLVRAVTSANHAMRRKLVRIALDLNAETAARIVSWAIASPDPVERLWGSRKLGEVYSGARLDDLLREMSMDTSMPVRREALLAYARIHPEEASHIWNARLLDNHRSIRELARFYLRKLGETDIARIYRSELQKNPQSVTALAGLGETGAAVDAEWIVSFLQNHAAGMRRAAVRALAALGTDSLVTKHLQRSICDDSPSVVRAAGIALIERKATVEAGELYASAEADGRSHVGRATLEVLDELGKWASLPFLVRLAASGAPDVASSARSYVRRWFAPERTNRVFATPSAREREQLRTAILETAKRQSAEFLKELHVWLDDSYFSAT